MTEDNNELLERFFSEAARQEIADDGFTERVMQHLPLERVESQTAGNRWFVRIWNVLCVLLFIGLFVAFDGWHLLTDYVLGQLYTLATTPLISHLPMMCAIFFGLLLVTMGEVVVREKVRI